MFGLRHPSQTEREPPQRAEDHADNGAFEGHYRAVDKQRAVLLDNFPTESRHNLSLKKTAIGPIGDRRKKEEALLRR